MAEPFTNQQIIDLLFAIAPQFITDDPVVLARYNALIDALECLVNRYFLGCCGLLAYANLLAHFLTLSGNQWIGVTNSITEGQLSLGIANTLNSSPYGATIYGQTYLALIGNVKIGGFVTNSNRSWWIGPPCGC